MPEYDWEAIWERIERRIDTKQLKSPQKKAMEIELRQAMEKAPASIKGKQGSMKGLLSERANAPAQFMKNIKIRQEILKKQGLKITEGKWKKHNAWFARGPKGRFATWGTYK